METIISKRNQLINYLKNESTSSVPSNIDQGTNNTINGIHNVIEFGTLNNVKGDKNILNGSKNNVNGSDNNINGNENTITSKYDVI